MKVFVFVLITLLFVGCGVDTDSSGEPPRGGPPGTEDGTDTNDTTDDGNTDDGTTDDGNTDDGTTVIVDDPSEAGFNKSGAVYDSIACLVNNDYMAIEDTSFNPDTAADDANGVEISSGYGFSTDLDATNVALFYPTLAGSLQGGSMLQVQEEYYRFAYDKAWSTSSNGIIYIMTPMDIYGTYSCYRYKLNSLNGDTIEKTKVYR
jgi:hypothetical protein